MRYAVEDLTKRLDHWTCKLVWYNSCYCETKDNFKNVTIYQDRRPNLEEVKKAANIQGHL